MPPRERFDKELSGLTADLMDMGSMVNGILRTGFKRAMWRSTALNGI